MPGEAQQNSPVPAAESTPHSGSNRKQPSLYFQPSNTRCPWAWALLLDSAPGGRKWLIPIMSSVSEFWGNRRQKGPPSTADLPFVY